MRAWEPRAPERHPEGRTMFIEIHSTRTIELDDADDAGLARLTGILEAHHVQGDTLYDKIEELNRYDDQDALAAIVAAFGDDFDPEHSVSDYEIDGLYPEDEEEEEEEDDPEPVGTVDAMNLPAWT